LTELDAALTELDAILSIPEENLDATQEDDLMEGENILSLSEEEP